jgi:hypothetical protein
MERESPLPLRAGPKPKEGEKASAPIGVVLWIACGATRRERTARIAVVSNPVAQLADGVRSDLDVTTLAEATGSGRWLMKLCLDSALTTTIVY